MNKSKYLIVLVILFFTLAIGVIFFNSAIDLYLKRTVIIQKISQYLTFSKKDKFKSVNALTTDKQPPAFPYDTLKLTQDCADNYARSGHGTSLKRKCEDDMGAWTAPFDWNVESLHAILLPDGTVLTFGSYSGAPIEKLSPDGKIIKQSIVGNKKIKLSGGRFGSEDGLEIERDGGARQWPGHAVWGGVDFDVWDPSKGYGKESHTLYKKPIVLDAFCSVVRVFDLENVFILGGNREPKVAAVDTQYATTFFNIKDKKFTSGNKLHYPRWYGSIVRLADDKFVMLGGKDRFPQRDDTLHFAGKITKNECLEESEECGNPKYSTIPEILQKDSDGIYYWKTLDGAESKDFFGNPNEDGSWYYPKSYLASDGNIFGISYNKLWVLDPEGTGSIKKVKEIPLEQGGITKIIEDKDPNTGEIKSRLIVGTVGAGVGETGSSVMIDKDKILLIGGQQKGYLPSNHVNLIDISNTENPKITPLNKMHHGRSNADAIILPDGNVLVHGGNSYTDEEFTNLTPEIYNVNTNKWTELAPGTMRRNYHSSSLLLPNGTILFSGGDVWNAEIYYPPYLFEKNRQSKIVFAKRPVIKTIKKNILDRKNIEIVLDDTVNLNKISLISTGAVTHAQASELKYLSLDFKKLSENKISISIPEDKNIIQNGTYLIFALNEKGVPSIGKIVMLN
jgi:hypothetical protein